MNLSTTATTPALDGLPGPDSIDALTVDQIDREVAQLTNLLEHRESRSEVAVALECRRQTLVAARMTAVARERADARRLHDERAQAARATFDALETELGRTLRAQADSLDAWVRDGAALMAAYRATLDRFAELNAVLVRPPVGREWHLSTLFERLRIDETLEECLAKAGVLGHITLPPLARDPAATVAVCVGARLQRFFNEARQRLPAAPVPHDPRETEEEGI